MMQKKLLNILLALSLFCCLSCSKYEVHTKNNITIDNIGIENINTNLDIIHIKADSTDLTYMMNYPDIETKIEAIFDMYSEEGPVISNKSVEIKIKGTTTIWYDLKSLKVKFNRKINNQIIPIIRVENLLPGHSLEELKKISLRNSGNDFFETFIKDISYSELAIQLGLNLELSYYKPVQVFINEKYYGLLNLRTEKDDNSLGKLLNVNNEDINILKIAHLGDEQEIIEFGSGDSLVIQELIDAVAQENKSYLLENIDLQCFADYIVFEDFIGNSDWPHNNVQVYNVGPNGKFRFFLYDLDFAADMDKKFMAESTKPGFIKKLYDLLLSDPDFKALIKKRQAYIYNSATLELFQSIINKNAYKIENEIIYNISKYQTPKNLVMWYYDLQRLGEKYETRRKLFKWYYNF